MPLNGYPQGGYPGFIDLVGTGGGETLVDLSAPTYGPEIEGKGLVYSLPANGNVTLSPLVTGGIVSVYNVSPSGTLRVDCAAGIGGQPSRLMMPGESYRLVWNGLTFIRLSGRSIAAEAVIANSVGNFPITSTFANIPQASTSISPPAATVLQWTCPRSGDYLVFFQGRIQDGIGLGTNYYLGFGPSPVDSGTYGLWLGVSSQRTGLANTLIMPFTEGQVARIYMWGGGSFFVYNVNARVVELDPF